MEELCESFDHVGSALEISELFGELYARASAHFALEERFMRERNYAFYDAHKADHEHLLGQIRNLMDIHEDGMPSYSGTSISGCLVAWFTGHVVDMDTGLRTLVQ